MLNSNFTHIKHYDQNEAVNTLVLQLSYASMKQTTGGGGGGGGRGEKEK